MIRQPAVAGTFYPDSISELDRLLDDCFSKAAGPPARQEAPLALVVPHAGLIYSGPVAATAYLAIPQSHQVDVAAVLGPNHSGYGPPVSVSRADAWRMPWGDIPLDSALAAELAASVDGCAADDLAHYREHSLEVQLPFLRRRLAPGFALLPVAIGCLPGRDGLEVCRELGQALARLLAGRRAILVLSSDMSHYLSAEEAAGRDRPVLEALESMDPERLVKEAVRRRASMCGVMAVAAGLEAAAAMGASSVEVVDYRTSGDVTGDLTSVVAYAAACIYV